MIGTTQAPPTILDRARLFLDLQQHHRRNLSEIAIRKTLTSILGKTRKPPPGTSKFLDRFMADHRDILGWVPPQGGMTAFPWLVNGRQLNQESARPFCQRRHEHGILTRSRRLLGCPSHFRCFAAAGRQSPQGTRPLRKHCKELAGQAGHSMTVAA